MGIDGKVLHWVSATDWYDIYGSITKCQVACVLRLGAASNDEGTS